MNKLKEKTIGEIVSEDYRTAAVFASFGIDFCCKGNRTLDEACNTKAVDLAMVRHKLDEVYNTQQGNARDFNSWPIDLLADYIEKQHHRYVEKQIPIINQYLTKLCKVHGDRHPELFEIEREFSQSAGELAKHMKKEELVLFPYIRNMVKALEANQTLQDPHFMTVKNPIQMMLREHDVEGNRFRKIAELSNHYTPPADACTTYKVAYATLKEFEDDLHLHIHLENNILFPKSIELEKEVRIVC